MLKISFISLKILCDYDRDCMVKSYTSFSTFLPLLNETFVFSRKKTTKCVSKMTLCIKAVINMEDKCTLNLD